MSGVCPTCGAVYGASHEFCPRDGARLGSTAERVTIGGYELLDRLSAGASGTVFRARDRRQGRERALKLLKGELHGNRRAVTRFEREAEALRRLEHPNVVQLFDFGEEGGQHYLVLELVEGSSLAEVLRSQGVLPVREVAAIGKQAALALAAAHRAGLVHRDLKPANLMLGREGARTLVKLIDFGVVSFDGADDERTRLTQDGFAVGTPAYMAPELFDGGEVSPASDLYALGVILFEMLTGRPPFVGSLAEIIAGHLHQPPPPLRSHDGLGPLCRRLLAKRPEERPPGALQVADELGALELLPLAETLSGELPVVAERTALLTAPTAVTAPPRPPARRLLRATLLVLGTGTVLGLLLSAPFDPRLQSSPTAADDPRATGAVPLEETRPVADLGGPPPSLLRGETRRAAPEPSPSLGPPAASPTRPAAEPAVAGRQAQTTAPEAAPARRTRAGGGRGPRAVVVRSENAALAEPADSPEPEAAGLAVGGEVSPPSVSELRARLDRFAARFDAAEPADPLLRDYLDLRTEVRRGATREQLVELARRLERLEERAGAAPLTR